MNKEDLEFTESNNHARFYKFRVGSDCDGSVVNLMVCVYVTHGTCQHINSAITLLISSSPGHFLLLTWHSLISEISGQGVPKGDGYWRTCRVRVSWPRLKPQVLPEREQGLHSLHSPISQCTEQRIEKSLNWLLFFL